MKKRIIATILCSLLIANTINPIAVSADEIIICEDGQNYEEVGDGGDDQIIVIDEGSSEDSSEDSSEEYVQDGTTDEDAVYTPEDEFVLQDTSEAEDGGEELILDETVHEEIIAEAVIEEEAILEEIDDADDGRVKIVGFEPFDVNEHSIEISSINKPSLKELLSLFPKTLNVSVSRNGKIVSEEISVNWYCVGEDYETSNGYYFQFSPKWDESAYRLAKGLVVSKDAPYIPVSVNVQSAAGANNSVSGIKGNTIFVDTIQTQENKDYVFKYLTGSMGLSSAAACGIMANIQYESGFRPDIYGDNGTSYGLCQWHNSRFTNLKNYCARNGYNYTTVEGQMHFLEYELVNTYCGVYNYMKGVSNTADGSYDAGYYWCVKFEVPANKEQKGVIRGNLARDTYWPKYGQGSPDNPIENEYNIYYMLNGGDNSPYNPSKYTSKTETFRLYEPTRKGYVFEGWYLDYYTTKVTQITKGTKGDIILWANYVPITYNVKFYGNNSTSGSVSSIYSCKYDSAFKLNTNKFKRKGYAFNGWNTKKDGSGKSYKDKASVKNLTATDGKTIKLYAQWIKTDKIKYTIKFNSNGATSGSMSRMTDCRYNKEIKLRKNHYKRKGYIFAGWNTKKDGSGDDYDDEEYVSGLTNKNNGVVTLYAMWEKK